MLRLTRTNSDHPDFHTLVRALDEDLSIRNGEDNAFFAQFNKIDRIRHVVLAHQDGQPVGCGAIKPYDAHTMEVKRMFVPLAHRGKGIAASILAELERWSHELGCSRCILETGEKQPEAIRLYQKSRYHRIPNFGPYAGVASSVCFEKTLG